MSEDTYVRGAGAVSIDPRQVGVVLAAIAVIVLAATTALLVVLGVSADSASSRIQNHGVPVQATVTSCIGVSSGIGMAVEYYDCRGRFSLAGATFENRIGGLRTQLPAGTTVAALVVPGQPGTLTAARTARSSSAGAGDYAGAAVAGAATLAVAGGMVVWRRRGRRPRGVVAGGPAV